MVGMVNVPLPKPRLRGVSHQWAFFCSLFTVPRSVTLEPVVMTLTFFPENESELETTSCLRMSAVIFVSDELLP